MTKIERLKELKEMLDQNLINQSEFNRLRSEILSMPEMPPMGNTGKPFSMPPNPERDLIIFRNPRTGETATVERGPTFWLTLILGCFYLAYKEVWLHAGIALVLGFFTYGLSWLVYPFFAYRVIVDTYRRKGWIEDGVSTPPVPSKRWLDRFLLLEPEGGHEQK